MDFVITPENVRVCGRNCGKTGVRVSWENSGVEVRFIGSGLSLEIAVEGAAANDLPYIQVWIDGSRAARMAVQNGANSYTAASGLDDCEHTVKVLLVTENFYTPLSFNSVAVSGNAPKLLEPEHDPEQLIFDAYGDSLTAGHGTIKGYPDYCTAASDSSVTFIGHAAQRLGADLHTVAISGWGVYHGWGRDPNGIIPRVWKFESMSTSDEWDGFAKRNADIVAVGLGTNDMWFWDDLDPELFISAYFRFLNDIRSVYPEAYIFCLFGCLGEYNGFFDKIREAVRRFCEVDTVGAFFVKMPDAGSDPERYIGSNGHPSGEYGEYSSAALLDAIEEHFYKDWQRRLNGAAERLEAADESGAYAELIADAKRTAADRHSTGRNPKRFCAEIESVLNKM